MSASASPGLRDQCARNCSECARLCAQCADGCLSGGKADEMSACIRLCLDCTTLCTTCIELLPRKSRFAGRACAVCAELSEACAAECDKYDDDLMKQCAQACRRCVDTCRQMAFQCMAEKCDVT